MVQIELLYFDGCPSWRRAWSELGIAIAEAGTSASVRLRNISGLSEEQLQGFRGSPTVRIDGRDLEAYEGPPLLACRWYHTSNEGRGWPSQARLQEALRRADRAEADA